MNVKLEDTLEMYTWKANTQSRWRKFTWLVFGVVELSLVTHFLLKLFVPDAVGVFFSLIESITEYLLLPLTAVFGASATPGPVFEWLTLFAILGYWLLGMGILALFKTSTGTSRIEITRAYSKRKYGY